MFLARARCGPLKCSDSERRGGTLVCPCPRCGSNISHRRTGPDAVCAADVLGERKRDGRGELVSLPPDQFRPQIRRDYPLNLSISISGGKETNQNSPSNGERTGKSSTFKSALLAASNCSFQRRYPRVEGRSKLLGTAYQRG